MEICDFSSLWRFCSLSLPQVKQNKLVVSRMGDLTHELSKHLKKLRNNIFPLFVCCTIPYLLPPPIRLYTSLHFLHILLETRFLLFCDFLCFLPVLSRIRCNFIIVCINHCLCIKLYHCCINHCLYICQVLCDFILIL